MSDRGARALAERLGDGDAKAPTGYMREAERILSDSGLFIPDARSILAEARAGLRAADACQLDPEHHRLCGACAAMVVYPLRLIVRAADGPDEDASSQHEPTVEGRY